MRGLAVVLTLLAAGAAAGCGDAVTNAPPALELPSELEVQTFINPIVRDGLRSASTVSSLITDPGRGAGVLRSAEYVVRDSQGTVLAHEAMSEPIAFGGNATVTFQRTLAWAPADARGRSLRVHYVVDAGNATVYDFDRTITF